MPATATRSSAGDHGDADQLVEVLRLGDRLLLDDDPALLGHRGRVDEVDLLLGATLQRALDHRERQQARVEVRDAAHEGRLDALDRAALGELHRQTPELAGERQERAEHLHVLRADRGDVDGRRDHPAGQRRDDLLGALVARAVGRLRGGGAEVRA